MRNKKGQFVKGLIPWNKAMKGIHLSPFSEWKKGMIPWNKQESLKKICVTCNKSFEIGAAFDRVLTCSRSCGQKLRFKNNQHPRWIKDRTKLKRISTQGERRTSIYKNWRYEVWKRDNYKCQIANFNCNGRVEAHHILSWLDYPELRYEINNGITLCHAHHPRVKAKEKQLVPYFMGLVATKV